MNVRNFTLTYEQKSIISYYVPDSDDESSVWISSVIFLTDLSEAESMSLSSSLTDKPLNSSHNCSSVKLFSLRSAALLNSASSASLFLISERNLYII